MTFHESRPAGSSLMFTYYYAPPLRILSLPEMVEYAMIKT